MIRLLILLLCFQLVSCGKKLKGEVTGNPVVTVDVPKEYDVTVAQKIDIIGMYNDLIAICEKSYGIGTPQFDECKEKSAQFIFDLNLDQGQQLNENN